MPTGFPRNCEHFWSDIFKDVLRSSTHTLGFVVLLRSLEEWRRTETQSAFAHPDDRERERAFFPVLGQAVLLLYYRLNVFPLDMPPLRERREDIPVLVEYFIGRYARKAGKIFRRVAKRTLDCLRSYPWPGNIRELQNVIERSVIVSDTEELTVDESWLSTTPQVENRFGLSGTLAAHEKAIVEDALRASGGRVFGPSGAAARLGIPRSTLESKIRALKINKSRFRTRAPKSS